MNQDVLITITYSPQQNNFQDLTFEDRELQQRPKNDVECDVCETLCCRDVKVDELIEREVHKMMLDNKNEQK